MQDQLNFLILLTQVLLAAFFYLRGKVLALGLLALSAFYWIDFSQPFSPANLVFGIIGGFSALLFAIAIPLTVIDLWRSRFLKRADRAVAQGDFKGARHWLDEYEKRYGRSVLHYVYRAQILIEMREYAEVLDLMQQADEEEFSGLGITWQRVWALCRLERHSEALTLLEEQILEHPQGELAYASLLIFYARVFVDLKQIENANESIRQVDNWLKRNQNRMPSAAKEMFLRDLSVCREMYNALLDEDSLAQRSTENGD